MLIGEYETIFEEDNIICQYGWSPKARIPVKMGHSVIQNSFFYSIFKIYPDAAIRSCFIG